MSRFAAKLLSPAVIGAALALAPAAAHAETGVKVGVLKCYVDGSVGLVFGSTKTVRCYYTPLNSRRREWYTGHINKYGIDLGYTKRGVMLWTVMAPTKGIKRGALAGSYGGITADLAAGYGISAKALIGGFKRSVALQPLSIEGVEGINVAAGIAELTLRPAAK